MGDDEYLFVSPEGLQKLAEVYDPKDPLKNINWTVDYKMELPIRMKREGPAADPPRTLIELFQSSLKSFPNAAALSVKRNNKWVQWNYKQYYEDACAFASGLLAIEVQEYRSINIIGFNAPEWHISFYGSVFGYYLPVGIYTTNGPEACQYISSHSDCEVVVLENREHLKKYLQVWDSLPLLKAIVVYNDPKIPQELIPPNRRAQVHQWDAFLEMGRKYKAKCEENSLENRMRKQKPGNCCTLVYTSGTTGPPKGVMLSHDNYVYPSVAIMRDRNYPEPPRIVSYLPLSHVAAQCIDIVGSLYKGAHIFFAQPDALSGSLVETLREVRPNFFFSVPRVWEKIEEKMKMMASQNGFVKQSIATWAKSIGKEGTFAETHNLPPPLCFGLAKKLVYNNVRKALGLDKAKYLMFGAAPLSPAIREYFLSLNMFLMNGYGMSECAGAQTISDPDNFDKFDADFMVSTGRSIPGAEIMIYQPDKDGNGEICYRGRHIFMGYYKNEEATRQTIDQNKYLHSGDVGKLDKLGNLKITGRIKELIITAGGENVAPVLIENEIKDELKFLANCMVIGEQRRFLTVLLTLKHAMDKNGQLTKQLAEDVIMYFQQLGSKSQTLEDVRKDQVVLKRIQEGIEKANSRAISKAQHIKKWEILEGDFTVDGGELTPTLKLKRKEVVNKNLAVIERMYQEAKL